MKKVYLETDRLILKTIGPQYASKILAFYESNKDFLEAFEPGRESYFYTKYHQKQLIKWDLDGLNHSALLRVWIFTKDNPDLPIGTIALSNITRGVFQSCFLGYKIDKDHSRKGYMTEALFQMIHYAFYDMKLHRIEANIMPNNIASINLVKKFGFENEGLAKKYLKIKGKWEDHIHMVLLNEG
jgi:ribosomal-protein-alanine N-acetyltransferase